MGNFFTKKIKDPVEASNKLIGHKFN